ncbi:hypothetical protein TRFO_26231 [Tritrichomonas foetus]|uniref:Fringe-like family protein n=1 Tax=Tritrichomonas foetus TaxID=1144522 RepID=A0A1J4K8W6_9EUKA|nr:hypothetical protein TRFO_26231 [Tritrichomonas foetus]|eukprot:OHT05877.1 hypothetical protein TRFO_26231 [Tritrichomonas foetus]
MQIIFLTIFSAGLLYCFKATMIFAAQKTKQMQTDINIAKLDRIALLVVQTYHKNVQRQDYHLRNWISQLPSFPQFLAAFVSDSPIVDEVKSNATYKTLLVPEQEYVIRDHLFNNSFPFRKVQTSFILTFNQSLRYFLSTPADYFFRIDDDGSYYLPNVQKAIRELSRQKIDPRRDRIIRGTCCFWQGAHFFGGGNSFLMSRAAAEDLIKVYDEWGYNIDTPCDVYLMTLLKRFNDTVENMTIGGVTAGFTNDFYEIAAKGEWNRLETCPTSNFPGDRCPGAFHRVRDMFSFHHFWDFNQYHTSWEELLKNGTFPDTVFYHRCNWMCHACVANKETQEKHPELFPVH